jgi:hypothetical protein
MLKGDGLIYRSGTLRGNEYLCKANIADTLELHCFCAELLSPLWGRGEDRLVFLPRWLGMQELPACDGSVVMELCSFEILRAMAM